MLDDVPAPFSPLRRALAGLVGTLVGTLLVSGCTQDKAAAPEPEPSTDVGTPLADVSTQRLAVARQPFCDRLDDAAVERALDGPVRRERAYVSGEKTRVTDEVTEVVHEHGCVFHGPAGASVRAWVFAPPVTRGLAADLVAAARATKACRADETAPAFGRPWVALRCRGSDGLSVSWRGLFGDAWLVCEVTARGEDDDAVADRASRWCAEVVRAAGS